MFSTPHRSSGTHNRSREVGVASGWSCCLWRPLLTWLVAAQTSRPSRPDLFVCWLEVHFGHSWKIPYQYGEEVVLTRAAFVGVPSRKLVERLFPFCQRKQRNRGRQWKNIRVEMSRLIATRKGTIIGFFFNRTLATW